MSNKQKINMICIIQVYIHTHRYYSIIVYFGVFFHYMFVNLKIDIA